MLRDNHIRPTLPLAFESIDCPACFSPLEFHQPDPRMPRRLLATCRACRSWFLATDGVMARLPDEDDFLDAALSPVDPAECGTSRDSWPPDSRPLS